MWSPDGSGKPFPDKLHLDGYKIEAVREDGHWRIWIRLVVEGSVVQSRQVWTAPDEPKYAAAVSRIVRLYEAVAQYFQLNNASYASNYDSLLAIEVACGVNDIAEFCVRDCPFVLTDWDYLTSRAPDDHIYKHKTDDRYLRVVENQFTEELTPAELERMLRRDQAADEETW